MKRLMRWIPALVVVAATSLVACGEEEKAAAGEVTEENADTAGTKESEAEPEEAEAAAPKAEVADKVPAEAAEPAAGEAVEPKVEATKPPPMSPEQEAAVKERCGSAFDNTVAIAQTAGAPAQIVSQMRQQRDKTVAGCLTQAKNDPSGSRMLDCMIAARTPVDIQTCSRKFGDVKPLKPPVPVQDGHGH